MGKDRADGTQERAWIAEWVSKLMKARGLGPAKVGRLCGVTSQRISQVTAGTDPPGLELLWRLAAVLGGEEEEEYAAVSEDRIRAVLERLIVSLFPRRLLYLADLSSSEAQAIADAHELRRAGAERLRGSAVPQEHDAKNRNPS